MKKTTPMCTLALSAGTVCAADGTGQWYLTPQAGCFWTDNERNVGDDWLHGLAFGKRVSNNWEYRAQPEQSGPTPAAESSSSIDGAGVEVNGVDGEILDYPASVDIFPS
jgi:hypothetical protein